MGRPLFCPQHSISNIELKVRLAVWDRLVESHVTSSLKASIACTRNILDEPLVTKHKKRFGMINNHIPSYDRIFLPPLRFPNLLTSVRRRVEPS